MIPIVEWIGTHMAGLLLTGGITFITLLATIVIVPFLLIRIPETYFINPRRHPKKYHSIHPVMRFFILLTKNITGLLLFISGIAMLFLPGQGLLTILAGFLVMDFPGKYHIEKKLISNENVIGTVNWIRQKANRPPLLTERGLEEIPS